MRNLEITQEVKTMQGEYLKGLEQKVKENRYFGKRLIEENQEQNRMRLEKEVLEKESDKKWIIEIQQKEKELIELEFQEVLFIKMILFEKKSFILIKKK